jgi:4-hydroxy 2-oxovalerate aldolase
MELLLGFLGDQRFSLRPIVAALQHHIEPLRSSVNWGPCLPYHITGQLNRHPRDAMEWLAGEAAGDSTAFYDMVCAGD